ncbi:TonB-dependent receptor plug domain-containing protein [Caulobacter sp.]|uniref:TonB-dependent receptor plug domain-containing protein n=1 Tax=Caulobacter sp. TaxID=78 RepID=UPI003BAF6645
MRGNSVCAALLASALVAAPATLAFAQGSRSLPVDTTGQSLATALTDLARRSGRELLLAAPTIGGRAAPRLKGRYTIDQALPLLLAGSNLAYRRTADGAYIVYVAPVLSPPEPDVPVALPELLITGRSQNSDIQRTENDIQAYKVWSSRDIQQAHSADLNEFLRVMATGDAQTASALQDPANTTASTRSEINLRGMGSDQTLVLVDGRRMPGLPPGAVGGAAAVSQADVNGLPLAAVDRIEILNATAGGIYGTGATAGAVNIVLKRDYHGADVGVTYGITDRGDAPTRRIDGRIGFSFGEDHTQVMVAFGLLRSESLSVGDRDYEARSRARRYANDPGQRFAELPVSGSVNVFSADGGPLSLDPAYGGASLGAAATFAPLSYAGPASDRGALLLTNAGRVDIGLSPDTNGANRPLLSEREVSSVIASVRHRFSPAIEAYADLLMLRNAGQAFIPEGANQSIYLPAAAPTNPFLQPVVMTIPLQGLDPSGRNVTRTARGSAGMIVDLPHGWKFNADYSLGRASIDAVLTQPFFKLDFYTAVETGQSVGGGGIIDPLGGGQALAGALASYTTVAQADYSQANHFRDRSLRLAGPIVDLGGGPLTLTLTAEDRRDHIPPSSANIPLPGLSDPLVLPLQGLIQTSRYYYGELRAPATDRYAGPSGLKGLEFQLALRHEEGHEQPPINPASVAPSDTDQQHAIQSTSVYTVGFKVYPVDGLMMRASAASGILPPVASQLGTSAVHYTSDPDIYATLTGRKVLLTSDRQPTDPQRGGQPLGIAGAYDLITGGASDLQAERARSVSAGVVLTPLQRLRLSVDYTRIDKHQEIVNFHSGDMTYFLVHENQYPDRVTRAPLTDGDRAKGYASGVVTAVDTTSFNIGRTSIEAIDAQGDYLIPTEHMGDFRLRVAATWQPHLRRKADPESPVVNYVGYADGPLAWRANGGLDWSNGATTLGFNVSYYGRYRVHDRLETAANAAVLTQWQGSPWVRAQAYVDLFATHKLTFGKTSDPQDLEVRFGVQNVLDSSPPLIARPVRFGFTSFNYSPHGDPRRRRFELSLVGHF